VVVEKPEGERPERPCIKLIDDQGKGHRLTHRGAGEKIAPREGGDELYFFMDEKEEGKKHSRE